MYSTVKYPTSHASWSQFLSGIHIKIAVYVLMLKNIYYWLLTIFFRLPNINNSIGFKNQSGYNSFNIITVTFNLKKFSWFSLHTCEKVSNSNGTFLVALWFSRYKEKYSLYSFVCVRESLWVWILERRGARCWRFKLFMNVKQREQVQGGVTRETLTLTRTASNCS